MLVIGLSVAFWLSGLSGLFTRFERIEFATGYPLSSTNAYAIAMKGKNTGSADISIVDVTMNGKPIGNFDNGNFSIVFTVTPPGGSAKTYRYARSSGIGGMDYSSGISVALTSGSTIELATYFSSYAPIVSGQPLEVKILTSSASEFGKFTRVMQTLGVSVSPNNVIEIASGLSSPSSLLVDGGFVYFTDRYSVSKVPVNGGTVATLLNDCILKGIITDDRYVYVSKGELPGCPAGILRISISDGLVVALVNDEQQVANRLLVLDGYLYYTANGSIKRVPLSGGAQQIVAAGDNAASVTATDGANLYYTTLDGKIKSVSINDLTRATILSVSPSPNNAIAYYQGFLYFIESGDIRKVDVKSREVQTIATSYQPAYLEVANGKVYFTDFRSGEIKSVPVGGGQVTVLASKFVNPFSIHLKDGAIYVADLTAGRIFKIPLNGNGYELFGAEIDIMPGGYPNPVNCKNQPLPDNVPVGIFTKAGFNARDIDLTSLTLEGVPVEEKHGTVHLEDLDGDGDLDGVVHLSKDQVCGATTNLPIGESVLVKLTGTAAGVKFRGADTILILKR